MGEKITAPSPSEPECGTNDKLLLLACEDGNLRACDVKNRKTVSCIIMKRKTQ